jgi:hypothetical protein
MDETVAVFEEEVKLFVNQRLFENGYITEDMYKRAKLAIVKNRTLKTAC